MTHLHPALDKLSRFSEFNDGWHYGDGIAPTKQTMINARKLIHIAIMSIFHVDVFPGIEGEIMVTVYHKDDYLEFTINRYGSVTYVHEVKRKEEDCREGISFKCAYKLLTSYRDRTWNSSESLAQNIMTHISKNSKASLLKTQPEAGFQSLTKNVLKQHASQYVNILTDSIGTSRQYCPCSG